MIGSAGRLIAAIVQHPPLKIIIRLDLFNFRENNHIVETHQVILNRYGRKTRWYAVGLSVNVYYSSN